MTARGLRLFGTKLRRRPLSALAGLVGDYLTYVGMVVFVIMLFVSKAPLVWLERVSRRPLRASLIAWVARLARG
jgi:hypothetical protein